MPPLPESESLDTFRMKFDGAVLRRGFWLYVWRIQSADRLLIYVGRTGDSSSPHASSPFHRIGQHLDFRASAKGNALANQLSKSGVSPHDCSFEMVAIGPLFPEARDMDTHRPIRDVVGAAEKHLAQTLRARGYDVIGSHASRTDTEPELLRRLNEVVDREFPALASLTAMSNVR